MNKFLVVAFTLFATHALAADSARDVMVKNEEARKLSSLEAKAKLEIGETGNAKATKVKDFTIWRKSQSDGIHNNTLTRFHAPAEVRDEGILILENTSGKNDVMIYLPNFKKIRRVESQQQSGSFMGSAFSYSEIATPHVDDYSYKMLGNEKCPHSELKCFKIEAVPANEDVKERTKYGRSILWVRPDNFMSEKVEHYQTDGKLWKVIKSADIQMVDPKEKRWLSHTVTVNNVQSNEYTVLKFSGVKANQTISDALFTQQNLQKVK